MAKRLTWANRMASELLAALVIGGNEVRSGGIRPVARALRAAEHRGYMRAVKLLREEPPDWTTARDWAKWLEERK